MLRILLVEDHAIVRRGVRSLIEGRAGWQLVGETADGAEGLQLALSDPPDVAIIDISLPRLDGIELTRQLKAARPEVRVLLFTVHDEEEAVRRGLEAGARGYLLKTDAESELEAALTALGSNRPYFSATISEMLLAAGSGRTRKTLQETLTARETEVLRLIARGHANREIARVLGVTPKTVETHRAAVMRKLEVRTAAQLVRYGVKQGIIET
jgi:DNA-binding NarL/FixJ family response regulator